MLIAGNKSYNLSNEIYKLYPTASFCSRSSGYNFLKKDDKERFAQESLDHDHILIISALADFHQIVLYDTVYKCCVKNKHRPHIITVGSTIDRSGTGNGRIYSTEKKALLEHTRNLNLQSYGNQGPKTTHISLGMLSNLQHKFPDRKTLPVSEAAQYIKWLIDQPKHVNINEISIDPMQDDFWYD